MNTADTSQRMLSVTLEPVPDTATLATDWCDLEARSDASFFLSWCWIGSWLKCLPPGVTPEALYVRAGDRVVGLAMVSAQAMRMLRFANGERLSVNETGNPAEDVISIEYNGILTDREMPEAVMQAALGWMMRQEGANKIIHLGGIGEDLYRLARDAADAAGRNEHILNHAPAPFVDLDQVRQSGTDYLSQLSRNSRQNIRRAHRAYEKRGPILLTRATTRQQATEFLAALKDLHQTYWNDRGRPGSFASPFFERFHTTLLEAGLAAGHIDLSCTTVNGEPIGYLYNFRWRGTVYAYQSGFRYETSNQYKPGYVCHTLAIENALAENLSLYDFMAGEAQHKRSLCTGTRDLIWVEFRNLSFATRLEIALRALKSRFAPRLPRRQI